MRALACLLTLVAAAALADGRYVRTNRRCEAGRSERGLPCDSYAFFEFAPASGAGMGTACACTTPTGAKGETLTFTRTSSATCTKTATGGLATSGIANGDLVTCSSGQPRVEYDSAGVLGLLVESSRTNVLLRSAELTNATWADVGTPGVTDGATDPFGTTTADTLTDDNAGAFEGRSQSVSVSAGAAYIMTCYLKAGTATTATLSLDGTTAAATGLSTTTWTRTQVADASSSGTSISAQVLVGDATTVTGSIVVGGCQVEAGTYATSYIPTTSSAVTRATESASFSVSFSTAAGYSVAASSVSAQPAAVATSVWGVVASLYQSDSNRTQLYRVFSNSATVNHISTSGTTTATASGTVPWVDGTTYRTALSHTAPGAGSVATYYRDGTLYATSASATTSAFTATSLFLNGLFSSAATEAIVVSRVCVDPDPTRCR